MNNSEKLAQVVSLASLFEKKEVLITVTEAERKGLLEGILDSQGTVCYASLPLRDLGVQSVSMQGVTIHLNVV